MIAEPPSADYIRYDPTKPVAVFLGPSLDRRRAEEILPANYYPPVRMGDIYRLIGSGVRLIVIIDGVFHRTAPVWQREILEALHHDITVIGASSMGALRAAELHTFGMIGHGTIFEWYRDGVIDGDDEVALNHGDESSGYRALSEPLVNIRATLADAVRCGRLTTDEAEALVAPVKAACYSERSWQSILRSLPEPRRKEFREFLTAGAINLKARDALAALELASTMRDSAATGNNDRVLGLPTSYHAEASMRRGFFHASGALLTGHFLVVEAWKHRDTLPGLEADLARRHFLLLWAEENGVRCPETWLHDFLCRNAPDEASLRECGLTYREHRLLMTEEAVVEWMLSQTPERFGLRFDQYLRYVEALLPILAGDNVEERRPTFLRKAAETCLLADWAKAHGIVIAADEVARFVQQWEESNGITDRSGWLQQIALSEADYDTVSSQRALYHLLGEKGPGWFGYDQWTFETALLRYLQRTRRAAHILAQVEIPPS